MAEDKKSFILYADYITTIEELTDAEAGKLVKHLFRYVNDLHPEPPEDRIVKLTFEPIKQQLKRDLKDWREKKARRSEAGKLGGVKSGEVRKQNEAKGSNASNDEAKPSNANDCEANEAVTVTVNGNVTVTDNVNNNQISADKIFEIMKQKAPKYFSDKLLELKAKEISKSTGEKKIEHLGAYVTKVLEKLKPDCKVKFYNPGAASYGLMDIDEWNKIKDRTALQFERYEAV